jgi:hypothetical protein
MQSNTSYISIAVGVLAAATTCYLTYKYWAGEKIKAQPVVGARKRKVSKPLDSSRLDTLDMLNNTKV